MIEALIAGLFGLLIGSFLNVCIYRMPRDLSVVTPRSYCPGCEHGIAWHDNIPVISFALLRGRCRYCRQPISSRYPLVELLTGALFFFAVFSLGPTLGALKLCVFCAICVELVFSDIEARILPDEFTLGGTVIGLAFAALIPEPGGIWRLLLPDVHNERMLSLLSAAFAAAFASGVMWLVGWLYLKIRHREGLGLGDVKMVAMIGAFLGLQGVLLTLIVGSTLGSLIGLAFIAITRKSAAQYELPFGSFLGAAAIGAAFYGEAVARWWMGLGA